MGAAEPAPRCAFGALMLIAGGAAIAFESAGWLGIIEIDRYWNGELQ